MKKIFTLFLTFVALFALVACKTTPVDNGGENQGQNQGGENQGGTYTPGITAQTSSFELKVGDKLNALDGVSAIDANGNDVTSQIQVSHLIPLDEEGCVKQSGEYQIKYVVTINGEKYNLYRTVTVIFELPQSDDLVVNGDFELGATDPFTKSEFDNGGATLSVVTEGENHLLKVDITAVSWQLVSPRVETNTFALTAGKYYTLSFKAKADEARSIQIQVGQLISEAPWFYGLGELNVDLTTELQTFELTFKADDAIATDLTKIQALFGFGTMPEGKSSAQTACYLDDIKVEETKVASLLNAESLNPELGGETDAANAPGVATVWYDQGAWCGAATEATFAMANGVISITGTQPAGSCWFATQLFLYAASQQAGNYTLSFNLKLNKDGNIKFGANSAQNVAIKAVNSQAVVAGDNALSVTFNVLEASQIGLSLQFGTEAGGNIGAFEAEVSDILLVRNGDPVVVDYADPANILGTIKGVKNDGQQAAEADPYTFYVWYVADANWGCGPVCTTSYEYADGALTLHSNLTDQHWWFATQIFYATEAIETAGTHKVTFKLNASAAGDITINGQKVTLVAGDNNIEFDAELKAGAKFVLSIQLGWLEGENTSHQYIGNNTLVLSEFKMDGVAAGTGNAQPAEKKDVDLLANPTITANGHQYAWQLSISKNGAGEWEWVGVKTTADLTGYNTVKVTVKGNAGERILFKVNDNGAGEEWVTCTGEAQEVTKTVDFAFDASKMTLVMFPNVQTLGEGHQFVITSLVLSGEGKDDINLLNAEVTKSDQTSFAKSLVLTKPVDNTNTWDSFWLEVSESVEGYKAVKYTVKGTEGERLLIKSADEFETFVTFTGEVQSGVIDLSDKTINPAKKAMILFVNPDAAGTGHEVVISELVFLVELPTE